MREDGQRTCFLLGQTPGAERVLLYDDFEQGPVKWTAAAPIPIDGILRSQTFVYTGNYALRVRIGGPAPDGLGWWYVYRTFPSVRSGLLECIGRFKLDPAALVLGYGFEIGFYQGGSLVRYGWRYDHQVRRVEYLDGRYGIWMDGQSGVYLAAEAWHEVWIRFRAERVEYERCGVDSVVCDLRTIPGYVEETGLADHARCNILSGRYGPAVVALWVDDVLIRKV